LNSRTTSRIVASRAAVIAWVVAPLAAVLYLYEEYSRTNGSSLGGLLWELMEVPVSAIFVVPGGAASAGHVGR
jgi:hypothetical protein